MKKFFSHHNVFFRNFLSSFLLSPSSLVGQSLIEILIAVAIGALLVIAAAGIIAPALRVNTQTGQSQVGASLGKELLDNLRVWSEGDWHNIGNLSTTSVNTYYLVTAQSPFTSASGTESVTVSTTTYTRYFYVDDVYRDVSGNITASGGTIDPSTKKITVAYTWPNQSATSTIAVYVTRYRNNIYDQTDWSGGANQGGPATTTNNRFSTSTNINYSSTTGSISINLASATPVTLGSWSTTVALPTISMVPQPYGLYRHTSIVNNSYIYALSGIGSSGLGVTTTVFYAPINSTGSIGSWSTTTGLPSGEQDAASVVNNNYVYFIGGADSGGSYTSTVFYAPINSTGSLGAWSTTTQIPNKIGFHTAVVNNSYIYVIGGSDGSNATSTVFYAPINSTGSLGAWSTTTGLPNTFEIHASVVNNGYVYVIAGSSPSFNSPTSTVLFAPINSTGSLGAWSTTTNLPYKLYEHASITKNNYVYVFAGVGGPNVTETSTVLYAPINSTGSIGSWSTLTKLPKTLSYHTAVVNGNYVYVIGGSNSNDGITSTVLYVPFQ